MRIRGAIVAAFVLAVCGVLPTALHAFKVRALPSWPANHENITASAIASVMAAPDPLLIRNIQQGVINTDLTHFNENEYHFDNSTVANGGFANGFDVLAGMALRAHAEAMLCDGAHPCGVLNPLFVHPQHSNYRELVEAIVGAYLDISVTNGCLGEPACWNENLEGRAVYLQTSLIPALVDIDPDPDVTTVLSNGVSTNSLPNIAPSVIRAKSDLDAVLGNKICRPWPDQRLCFEGIGVMAPTDNLFHLLVGQLQVLQLEYQAYFAWQHLGHAMHTTEDFFAHSNYVELASCRKGPPCAANSINAASCGVALDGGPNSWSSLPLPVDGKPLQDLVQFFLPNFDLPAVSATLNSQRAIFPDGNAPHLQTGNFPCLSATDPPNPEFQFCHTAGGDNPVSPNVGAAPTPAGLNKDQAFPTPTDNELNHQNFDWARVTATRTATALFASFLDSFPDGPALFSANPLAAAAPLGTRPSCGIAVSVAPPRLTVVGVPSSGPPDKVIAKPATPLVLIPRPLPPQLASLAATPAFRSSPLSHPELLQRDSRPRIYVIVSPNRAFHPGEQVQLEVDAYDASSGVPIPGMPISIGSVRGTTGTPLALTIPTPMAQRCANHGGQSVCLNDFTALVGNVADPAGRYPGGGGQFSLSIVAPRLQVSMIGGPALLAGAANFTVSAVDSQTGRPVSGATVALAGRVIGPANVPLSNKWPALSPNVNRPDTASTPVSLGPPMTVSAPGYGDALVHYYLLPAGTSLPPR
ncbi:MAG TPA: HET-C-related protein [Steroidobacteraceae bacterium]